ncbi:membrane protein insertion efficiency factor YidD [Mameliella sp.]|uniref:membrane protein insertion efficiency factor YidD n=1 Tax=Mameliella sp. TaxID=1924940 RepID=UPI003B503159
MTPLNRRSVLSSRLGQPCRFQPNDFTNSTEALKTHAPLRGLWLTLRRLVRCTPLGGTGYDLVSPLSNRKNTK